MKRLLIVFLMLGTGFLQAGVFNLSSFSRANCINNESISWDATSGEWAMKTVSIQSNVNGAFKIIEMSIEYGIHRSAAICLGCGLSGGWFVDGEHYIGADGGDKGSYLESFCDASWVNSGTESFAVPCRMTFSSTCNITEW